MTLTRSLQTDFPVYGAAFTSPDKLILIGGGGRGKTGVKNKIQVIDTTSETLKTLTQLELTTEEDAPMCIDLHPKDNKIITSINSAPDTLKADKNTNLRVFKISSDNDSISSVTAKSVTANRDEQEYDKTLRFSPDYSLLAVGSTTSEVLLFTWPSLEPLDLPPLSFDKSEEIYDLSFNASSSLLAITSDKKVVIVSISKEREVKNVESIEKPTFKKVQKGCSFRAAKFGRGSQESRLYTLVNTPPSGPKGRERHCFVSSWNTDSWTCSNSIRVSKKACTCMDISEDGLWIAVSSADLSVQVLESKYLKSAYHLKNVHKFPTTSLKFSPKPQGSDKCTYLVSASADNSVRIIHMDNISEPSSSSLTLIIALLIILVAILMARMQYTS